MSGSRQVTSPRSIPTSASEWDIGSFLRYEHERPDDATLLCDWRGDVPTVSIDAAIGVLRGQYPNGVYLAELPRAGAWTRKLKLLVPGQEGRVVTVVGGGSPRLWLGGEVAYELPNPKARYAGIVYRYVPSDGALSVEKLAFNEPQGGLAMAQCHTIHERMAQASVLLGEGPVVPVLAARGQFCVPGWEGAFLVYSEAANYRPAAFLRYGRGHQGLGRVVRTKAFCLGVRSLFRTLRTLNDGGMFHGDLVHRVHGGSANLGITPQGEVVLKGWGHRIDVDVAGWPAEAQHRQRMREVTGALAGLIHDILGSTLPQEDRQPMMVELVLHALKAYTGQEAPDHVELMIGLSTETDRLRRVMPVMPGGHQFQDEYAELVLHQECGQLPDEIRNWLVQCVTRYI
ncbi:hypothetical protein [Aggregatilinea lenta]|uniref:hypothetical protein n=1 Tax=Aggregatilinea lenta TaxID=913108 RepID=UPI0013C335AD|nr:hypothetical protein [Aggregatilinea lenta]